MDTRDGNYELADLVKRQLAERSLSLRKFSELVEVDAATISRILNGKRKANPEHLRRFARGLGMPESELFAAAGYPTQLAPSEFFESIDHIQEVLDPDRLRYRDFSIEGVKKELEKYERYSQTDEGQATVLRRFAEKLREVGGAGPFIHQLKALFRKFRVRQGSRVERALIGSALLYFIIPTDCIQDHLFPIGYIDDALAVKLVVHALQSKLHP